MTIIIIFSRLSLCKATLNGLLCCSKFIDGGGVFAAVVEAKCQGSLSFSDTFLSCKIQAVRAGMYSYTVALVRLYYLHIPLLCPLVVLP